MKKMIIDKLTQPQTHLNRDDLSPNQKKLLWDVMTRHGASQGFAYARFFNKGFKAWELVGITQTKENFLHIHEKKLRAALASVGDPHMDADMDLSQMALSDRFYDILGLAHLKLAFVIYMRDLGMGANAVLKRFGKYRECDFKDYEKIGINAVIRKFEHEVMERNIV